jgi:hypothetical protein
MPVGGAVYAVGSCFAEQMAARLRRYLFATVLNPHGIVYNPICAAGMLDPTWREPELFLHQGLWRSLAHHSSLAWGSRGEALQLLANAERLKAHALQSSRWLLLTLGTAQAFRLAGSGLVVANCHRLPQQLFRRQRLELQECLQALRAPLHEWLEQDEQRQAVLTVSPVRYLRDGLVENNRGKAVLLLVCEALEREHPRVHYFPAYEIVLDELRCYRYFERDMVHPNALAADLVWQRFAQTFLRAEDLPALEEMDKLLAALDHRPGPAGDLRALGRKSLQRLERLRESYPELQLQQWEESFRAMLV